MQCITSHPSSLNARLLCAYVPSQLTLQLSPEPCSVLLTVSTPCPLVCLQSLPEVSSGSDRRMLSAALNAMVGGSPQSLRAAASRSQQQQGQGQQGEGQNHPRPGSRAASPSLGGLPRNYSPVGGGGGGGHARGGGSRRCGSSFQREGSGDRALSSGSQQGGGGGGSRGSQQGGGRRVPDTFDNELEVAQALFDLKAGS